MLGYAGPMTVTLCIDTSTAHCSVALAAGDDVFADTQRLERRHNQELLPMLEALYQGAGLTVGQTQLVSFAAGPGGFTGVRIAASVAQAVAMACGCKVVAQRGSSVVMNSWDAEQHHSERSVCFVASRAQSFYVSEHVKEGSQWVLKTADELCEETPSWLNLLAQQATADSTSLAVLGPVPDWLPEQMRDCCVGEVAPDARSMIAPARHAHEHGASVAAEQALPIYVQGDSPWRKRR